MDDNKPVEVRIIIGGEVVTPRRARRADVAKSLGFAETDPNRFGFEALVAVPFGLNRVKIELLLEGRWVHATSLMVMRLTATPAPDIRGTGDDGIFYYIDAPSQQFMVSRAPIRIAGWALHTDPPAAGSVRIRLNDKIIRPIDMPRPDVLKAFQHIRGLPQDTGFNGLIDPPFGYNRIIVEVRKLDGDWDAICAFTTFRMPFVGRSGRSGEALSYPEWQKREAQFIAAQSEKFLEHLSIIPNKPEIGVVVDARGCTGQALTKTLESLRAQVYPAAGLTVFSDINSEFSVGTVRTVIGNPYAAAPEMPFTVYLRGGDTLRSDALYRFVDTLAAQPGTDMVYGDADHEPTERGANPFFRPAWSPDYLECINYIGPGALIRSSLFEGKERNCLYDVNLVAAETAKSVVHLPIILITQAVREDVTGLIENIDIEVQALDRRLARTGRSGKAKPISPTLGCYRIDPILDRQALVSIVIPTAGKTVDLDGRTINLPVNIVEQIQAISTYSNKEIILVENGDLEPDVRDRLIAAGAKLVLYGESIFNVAEKLNLGSRHASGELLILMNDDIELLTPDWIEQMAHQFEKPHVGVVGCKLLYPDMQTQHVGVVHNSGSPDHVRRLSPREELGYFFSTAGTRNFMAVTGACMMTRASVYKGVGGYTEALRISYNDADYCLKVGELGLSCVYLGSVEMIHFESQSRIASLDPSEARYYQKRWSNEIVSDPFYNEVFLSIAPPTFRPAINARLI